MKGLTQPQLFALSDNLLKLSTHEVPGVFRLSDLSRAICDQVKIKVDKKIAAAIMPKNGVNITLTRAEYIFLINMNKAQVLRGEVEFRNGLTRLLEYNQKKL
jgi:hypothetical protein